MSPGTNNCTVDTVTGSFPKPSMVSNLAGIEQSWLGNLGESIVWKGIEARLTSSSGGRVTIPLPKDLGFGDLVIEQSYVCEENTVKTYAVYCSRPDSFRHESPLQIAEATDLCEEIIGNFRARKEAPQARFVNVRKALKTIESPQWSVWKQGILKYTTDPLDQLVSRDVIAGRLAEYGAFLIQQRYQLKADIVWEERSSRKMILRIGSYRFQLLIPGSRKITSDYDATYSLTVSEENKPCKEIPTAWLQQQLSQALSTSLKSGIPLAKFDFMIYGNGWWLFDELSMSFRERVKFSNMQIALSIKDLFSYGYFSFASLLPSVGSTADSSISRSRFYVRGAGLSMIGMMRIVQYLPESRRAEIFKKFPNLKALFERHLSLSDVYNAAPFYSFWLSSSTANELDQLAKLLRTLHFAELNDAKNKGYGAALADLDNRPSLLSQFYQYCLGAVTIPEGFAGKGSLESIVKGQLSPDLETDKLQRKVLKKNSQEILNRTGFLNPDLNECWYAFVQTVLEQLAYFQLNLEKRDAEKAKKYGARFTAALLLSMESSEQTRNQIDSLVDQYYDFIKVVLGSGGEAIGFRKEFNRAAEEMAKIAIGGVVAQTISEAPRTPRKG